MTEHPSLKRALSMALVLAMVLSFFTISAFAENVDLATKIIFTKEDKTALTGTTVGTGAGSTTILGQWVHTSNSAVKVNAMSFTAKLTGDAVTAGVTFAVAKSSNKYASSDLDAEDFPLTGNGNNPSSQENTLSVTSAVANDVDWPSGSALVYFKLSVPNSTKISDLSSLFTLEGLDQDGDGKTYLASKDVTPFGRYILTGHTTICPSLTVTEKTSHGQLLSTNTVEQIVSTALDVTEYKADGTAVTNPTLTMHSATLGTDGNKITALSVGNNTVYFKGVTTGVTAGPLTLNAKGPYTYEVATGNVTATYGSTTGLDTSVKDKVTWTTGTPSEVNVTYFTDASCETKTTTATGATGVGTAPANAGTYYAKVTAVGAGDYADTTTNTAITVVIEPKPLNATMISDISAQDYTGEQIKPTVTVTDGSALTVDTDYTVTYDTNINAGTDAGSVTVTGKGNYTGEANKTFTINKAANTATITTTAQVMKTKTLDLRTLVSNIPAGSTVTYALKEGNEGGCEISGSTVTAGSSTGEATATITVGEGTNHLAKEAVDVTITIVDKYTQTLSFATDTVTKEFGDAAFTNTLTHTGNAPSSASAALGAVTYSSSDTDVATVNEKTGEVTIVAVGGPVTITATAAEAEYYNESTATYQLTVTKKSIADATVTLGTQATYDGTAQNVVITSVTLDGKTLEATTDYTIKSGGTATNVGATSLVLSGAGNYQGDTTGTEWTLVAAPLTIAAKNQEVDFGTDISKTTNDVTCTGLVDGDSLTSVMLTQSTTDATTNGTITPSAATTTKGAGNYTITYNTGALTINKVDATATAPTVKSSLEYTGNAQALIDAASGVTAGCTAQYCVKFGDGEFSAWSATVPTGTEAGTYTVKWKVVGDKNHNDSNEATLSAITIDKATVTLAVNINGWTYGESANAPTVTGNTAGATVTYTYYMSDGSAKTNTSEGATAEGGVPAKPGTYKVEASVPATGNYAAATSAKKEFTIAKAPVTLSFASSTVTVKAGASDGVVLSTQTATKSPTAAEGAIAYSATSDAKFNLNTSTGEVKATDNATVATDTFAVTATYAGNDYYLGATATYTIKVVGADDILYSASGDNGVYGDNKTHQITVEVTSPADYTIAYRTTGSGEYNLAENPTFTAVGTHTVYFKITADTKTAEGQADVVIAKATPTVTVTGNTLTYTGAAQDLVTATVPEGVSLSYTVNGSPAATAQGTKPGEYTVTYQAAESTNYSAVPVTTVVAKINKANVTVTAESKTWTIGDTGSFPPSFTATETGKPAAGEALPSYTVSCPTADKDTAGTYPITVTGPNNNDYYNITYVNGTLTVKAAGGGGGGTGGGGSTTPSSSDSTTGGGGGGGGYTPRDRDTDSSTTTNKNTTTNADGSTTTTVKNSDGSVTETTRATDGSTTTTKTEKTGEATTTEKAADGSTGTTKTDAAGNTVAASATVSQQAVRNAARYGSAVKVPVSVKASNSAASAAAVDIALPETSEPVAVEIPVENVSAGTVAVIVHSDGTEEIVKTSTVGKDGVVLTLDGSAKVKIVDNSKYFADVPSNEWYADNVAWASSREIMNGTGDFAFAPNDPTSRSMVAQLLFNLDGAAAPDEITTLFADVNPSDWYANSVTWAVSSGIARGMGDNLFGADQVVTREQFAVMMYNYAQLKGYDVSTSSSLTSFPDADGVSDWAADAMAWAVGVGLINGTTDANGSTVLNAQGTATRAQVAAIMQRFCEKVAK